MTDDVQRALDDHLMAALCLVLTAGHSVEHNTIRIEPVGEPKRYVVKGTDDDEFDDVRSAVALYLDLTDPSNSG